MTNAAEAAETFETAETDKIVEDDETDRGIFSVGRAAIFFLIPVFAGGRLPDPLILNFDLVLL